MTFNGIYLHIAEMQVFFNPKKETQNRVQNSFCPTINLNLHSYFLIGYFKSCNRFKSKELRQLNFNNIFIKSIHKTMDSNATHLRNMIQKCRKVEHFYSTKLVESLAIADWGEIDVIDDALAQKITLFAGRAEEIYTIEFFQVLKKLLAQKKSEGILKHTKKALKILKSEMTINIQKPLRKSFPQDDNWVNQHMQKSDRPLSHTQTQQTSMNKTLKIVNKNKMESEEQFTIQQEQKNMQFSQLSVNQVSSSKTIRDPDKRIYARQCLFFITFSNISRYLRSIVRFFSAKTKDFNIMEVFELEKGKFYLVSHNLTQQKIQAFTLKFNDIVLNPQNVNLFIEIKDVNYLANKQRLQTKLQRIYYQSEVTIEHIIPEDPYKNSLPNTIVCFKKKIHALTYYFLLMSSGTFRIRFVSLKYAYSWIDYNLKKTRMKEENKANTMDLQELKIDRLDIY